MVRLYILFQLNECFIQFNIDQTLILIKRYDILKIKRKEKNDIFLNNDIIAQNKDFKHFIYIF